MLIGNPAIRVWRLGPAIPCPLKAPTPRFPVTAFSSAFPSAAASPATQSAQLSPVSPSTPATSVPDDDDKLAFYSALTTAVESYAAPKALALSNTTPLPLASKEHLGILNGTAFSAGVAALAVNGAKDVAVLGAVSCAHVRVTTSAHMS